MHSPPELLSVVIPIYNERAALPLLLAGLHATLADLSCEAEVIFIDDGGSDGSDCLLRSAAAEDERIKVIELSRNFGQQLALSAGLDFASGDVVVLMDGDLQDPPELIPALLQKYQEGYDIVYAQRTRRDGETWLKKATATAFYWLMRKAVLPDLPSNTGDFRLMSRAAVDAFRQMQERHRFVRGIVTWLGFRQVAVPFERPARVAGRSAYSLRKTIALAWQAIVSFSGLPLRLSLLVGLLFLLASVAGTVFAAYRGLTTGADIPVWIWLVCFQSGLSGLTFLVLGVMGDYVARIYDEIKRRPLYVVRELVNLTEVVPLAPKLSRAVGHPYPPPREAGRVPVLPLTKAEGGLDDEYYGSRTHLGNQTVE